MFRSVPKLIAVLVLSIGTSVGAVHTPSAPCFNCHQDSGMTHHFCATAAECEGGDLCFVGCDHTAPVAGRCFQFHDHCSRLLVDSHQLIEAVKASNATAVQDILDSFPQSVHFNGLRRAIQIFDCNANVIDHIPVTDVLAEQLD